MMLKTRMNREMCDLFIGELLISILVRLVSSLVRLTAVCKEWQELIKSDCFIYAHLDYILSNSSPLTIVKHHSVSPKIERFSFKSDSHYCIDSALNANVTCPFHNVGSDYQLHHVVGCVHGLLCLTDLKRRATSPDDMIGFVHGFVWNPILGKFIQFKDQESPPYQIILECDLGFGYDRKKKDYKIVRISTIRRTESKFCEAKASVYALKENSWRELKSADVDVINHCCLGENGTCFCEMSGFLHWIVFMPWKKSIMCFDCITEKFSKMRLPQPLEVVPALAGYLFLAEISGSLAVIHTKQQEYGFFKGIDVWTRKDSGWNLLYAVDALSGPLRSFIGLSGSRSGLVLAMNCNQADEYELIQVDMKSMSTMKLGITSTIKTIYVGSYNPSLLLFNDDRGAIACQQIDPGTLKRSRCYLTWKFN